MHMAAILSLARALTHVHLFRVHLFYLQLPYAQDLLDYLSQLLGSSNESGIQDLVNDIGSYQRGEPLAAGNQQLVDAAKRQETTKATGQPAKTAAPAASRRKDQSKQKIVPGKKPPPSPKPPAAAAAAAAAAPQTAGKKKNATAAPTAASPSSSKPSPSASTGPKKPLAKRTPPPKGKAPYSCGCFGSLHKVLTNCLYCGRIACAKEGYNFCPFCGYLVEEDKDNRRREWYVHYNKNYSRDYRVKDLPNVCGFCVYICFNGHSSCIPYPLFSNI
jgi:hypothetical protein